MSAPLRELTKSGSSAYTVSKLFITRPRRSTTTMYAPYSSYTCWDFQRIYWVVAVPVPKSSPAVEVLFCAAR